MKTNSTPHGNHASRKGSPMDATSKTREASDLREVISCVTKLATLVESHLSEYESRQSGIPLGPQPSSEVYQLIKQLDRIAVGLDVEGVAR
jgi:hypothetical protein